MREMLIIADTSCLIALSKIDALWILEKVYQKVYVTTIIAGEFEEDLPAYIEVMEFQDLNLFRVLRSYLDAGEASALVLAIENPGSVLILDDLKGRKEANKLGLSYTGTLGVLVKASQTRIIPEILP